MLVIFLFVVMCCLRGIFFFMLCCLACGLLKLLSQLWYSGVIILVGISVFMCMLYGRSFIVYFWVRVSCVFFVVVYVEVLFCLVIVVLELMLRMLFCVFLRCGSRQWVRQQQWWRLFFSDCSQCLGFFFLSFMLLFVLVLFISLLIWLVIFNVCFIILWQFLVEFSVMMI